MGVEYRRAGSYAYMRRYYSEVYHQFGRPLDPKRATWRFKTGGPGTCDVPVRFVMRNPKTRDVVQFDTRTSLCSGPRNDSLVRIRAVVPEVRVEG